ncbi:MAG TPA: hypothetical protein VE398_23005 [Acidobacteriota bacterium]|nr:hypothetical protein [Acidobacteriota bacterium]
MYRLPRLLPGSVLCFAFVALTITSTSAAQASRFVSAFPTAAESLPLTDLEVRSTLNIRIISSNSVSKSRLLLLIIDPTGFSPAEIRKHVSALGLALSHASRFWESGSQVRVGVPVMDGILMDPIRDPGGVTSVVDAALSNYITEPFLAADNSLGRTLDVIANVVHYAEDGAALDCLVLAKDRSFTEEGSEYLEAGMERKFLEIAAKHGSTFYGLLQGHGELEKICVSTGGVTDSLETSPEAILGTIAGARERGYILELSSVEGIGGRYQFSIESRSSDHPIAVRSPHVFWNHPDGVAAPDYLSMRESLDCLRRAETAERDGSLTVGLRWLETAQDKDAWNPILLYRAARLASDLNDLELARRYLRRSLLFNTCSEEAIVFYCDVMRRLSHPSEALGVLEAKEASTHQESPAIQLEHARLLVEVGRLEEARLLYTSSLADRKDREQVLAELGRLLWRLGDQLGASEQLTAALRLSPSNATALTGQSEVALGRNELNAALDLARQAVQADSRNPDAIAQLGMVHSALRDWKPAEQHLLRALNLAPWRKEFIFALADVQFQTGRILDSTGLLRRLVSTDPSDTDARRKLSDMLVRAGRLAEAAATLESAAELSKKEASEFYLAAARLRERRSEYGQALLDYRAMQSTMDSAHISVSGSSLNQHILYLSMVLDGARELPRLPIAKELGIEAALAGLPEAESGPASAAGGRIRSLVIPGGLDLLARAIGVAAPEDRGPEALVQLFALIIDAASRPPGDDKEHSLSRKAIQHLRDFEDLVRHMKATHLLPEDFDPIRGQELTFSLLGNDEAFSRTARFLAFFGIACRFERGAGRGNVTIELRGNEKMTRRQQLLQHLGVNITRADQREFRVTIRDQEVPTLVDVELWSRQLPGGRARTSRGLLEQTLASPKGMKLYNALASCAESVRGVLLKAAATENLMDLAEALSIFGRYLDLREGRLMLPGSVAAWESLIGVPFSEPGPALLALLRRDGGRALILYAGLSAASREVQQYFTDSPERLRQLYECIPAFRSGRQGRFNASMGTQDFRRIMRQFIVQDGKLLVAGDMSAASHLSSVKSTESATLGADLILKDLPAILDARRSSSSSSSRIDAVELIRYLQAQHPQLLNEKNIDLIATSPGEAATQLDLIADLEPSPDQLADYIGYCRHLAVSGGKGWEMNRIRSSQSLFHLISLMRREGAIAAAQANTLLADSLAQLRSSDEGEYASALAHILSTRLLAALTPSAGARTNEDELILRALAGSSPVRDFVFEGRRLRFDASQLRLQNMKGAIQQQRFIPLATILEIYRLLESIRSDDGGTEELAASLAKKLAGMRAAQPESEHGKSSRPAIAGIDLAAAEGKLKELQSLGRNTAGRRRLSGELAAAFHPEIGVTLLTYCYAYYGSPAIDALTFDVNFVRKHDFLDSDLSRYIWRPAHLGGEQDASSFIVGSVAGLGYVLTRLETASAALGLSEEDALLLPSILAGMRAVRPELRSERAQEYVALVTRLGRELLTVAVLDKRLRRWCDGVLDHMVSPKRHESVSEALARLDTGVVPRTLTPSELFFLGQGYLGLTESGGTDVNREEIRGQPVPAGSADQIPDVSCPILNRLRKIISDAERADAAKFREEVVQYGIPLHSRLGMDAFTLRSPESYELLEQSRKKGVLFDRICDLKIRLADLHYALGLPAFVAEVEQELALRDILPRSEHIQVHSWKQVLDRINRLGIDSARSWIEEALNRGWLVVADEDQRRAEANPQ